MIISYHDIILLAWASITFIPKVKKKQWPLVTKKVHKKLKQKQHTQQKWRLVIRSVKWKKNNKKTPPKNTHTHTKITKPNYSWQTTCELIDWIKKINMREMTDEKQKSETKTVIEKEEISSTESVSRRWRYYLYWKKPPFLMRMHSSNNYT